MKWLRARYYFNLSYNFELKICTGMITTQLILNRHKTWAECISLCKSDMFAGLAVTTEAVCPFVFVSAYMSNIHYECPHTHILRKPNLSDVWMPQNQMWIPRRGVFIVPLLEIDSWQVLSCRGISVPKGTWPGSTYPQGVPDTSYKNYLKEKNNA